MTKKFNNIFSYVKIRHSQRGSFLNRQLLLCEYFCKNRNKVRINSLQRAKINFKDFFVTWYLMTSLWKFRLEIQFWYNIVWRNCKEEPSNFKKF
jgi:hypothetical protein